MKQNVKLIAPALCLLAIGCGGNHSASITFPLVRMFDAVDGVPSTAVQFHDLSANLLATTPQEIPGIANPPPDASFVYSLAAATILDNNGNPLYEGASFQYAQNSKYTVIACGGSATLQTIVLTDNEGVGTAGNVAIRFIDAAVFASPTLGVDVYVLPTGTTVIPGGATPAVTGLKYATIPTATNAATTDGNGYLIMPDGGATTFSVIFTVAGTQTPLFPAQAITVADAAYYTDVLWDTGITPAQKATLLADKR